MDNIGTAKLIIDGMISNKKWNLQTCKERTIEDNFTFKTYSKNIRYQIKNYLHLDRVPKFSEYENALLTGYFDELKSTLEQYTF